MRKVIGNYVHHSGNHCGSTALSNVCRFWGLKLSEPFCLGLGAGLAFRYVVLPGMSPSRAFFPRNHSLEQDFLRRSGAEWKLRVCTDGDPWEPVRDELDRGHPVIMNCDIFDLAYFQSKTHFNAHKIVVFGYDEEKQLAVISDSEFDEVQEEPLESLARARGSRAQPSMGAGSPWFEIAFPDPPPDWSSPVREAVRAQAEMLLDPRHPDSLAAMERAAADLPGWAAIPDLSWSARFAYQIIEKRGTGGGAFRKMYADFLEEAGRLVPELAGLSAEMSEVAAQWTRLSGVFKTVSALEGASPEALLAEAAGMLRSIHEGEARIFETARQRLG